MKYFCNIEDYKYGNSFNAVQLIKRLLKGAINMADVRKFKSYIEELSGNNLLKKQMAALEKANTRLERELKAIKNELNLIKKQKVTPAAAAKTGKKRGRKPRTMLQIIEAEMAKSKDNQMKVTDIVTILKKKFDSKAKNMYASVSASMNNSDKFEKAARGVYKLVAQGADKPVEQKAAAPGKKAAAKKKTAAKKKAVAKASVNKDMAPAAESEAKKPAAKKKATARKKTAAKKKAPAAKKSAAKKKAPASKKPAARKKAVAKKAAPAKNKAAKKAAPKKKAVSKKATTAK
jgi:hypothetical protein